MHIYYFKRLEAFGLDEDDIKKVESVAREMAYSYATSVEHAIESLVNAIDPMRDTAKALRAFNFAWDQFAVLNHSGGRGIRHRGY